MALYPLNPSSGIRSPRSGELAGDDWFASQGAPQMTAGPALRAQPPGSAFDASGAPMPGGGAPGGQPPTDRAGIVQWVTQHLGQYGIQPGPRGSGVGDVEYWADQILDPVNTGYGDWAGRIQRGVQGTQPPLPGQGGGLMSGGGVGGAFGTGVDYEAIRRLV